MDALQNRRSPLRWKAIWFNWKIGFKIEIRINLCQFWKLLKREEVLGSLKNKELKHSGSKKRYRHVMAVPGVTISATVTVSEKKPPFGGLTVESSAL